MNWGPDCDNDTARSPQTGEPVARISRDLGVIRKLSNLHSEIIRDTSDVKSLQTKLKGKCGSTLSNNKFRFIKAWQTLKLFGTVFLTSQASVQNIVALCQSQ